MSNKCEICYDTNIDYCITQEELDKALEGMLSKDELRYYTTQGQVDLMIEAAQIQTENKVARNYYNKGEIDTIVEALPTKQWVRSQGYVNESDVKDIVDESIEAADINIDLSDYYTKAQVDQKIVDAVTGGDIDLEGYVTDSEMKDAIEEAINEIDLTEFVTDSEMNTAIEDAVSNIEIPDPDLTDYYTKQEVDNIVDGIDVDLTGYATETWVQGQGYLKTIPSDYVTESELNSAVEDAVSNIEIPDPDLTDYYTKQEVDNIVDGIDVDLTGYATETWVQQQGYISSIPSDYVTEQELNTAISNIEIPTTDLSDYYNKQEVDDLIDGIEGDKSNIPSVIFQGTYAVVDGYPTITASPKGDLDGVIDAIKNNKPYILTYTGDVNGQDISLLGHSAGVYHPLQVSVANVAGIETISAIFSCMQDHPGDSTEGVGVKYDYFNLGWQPTQGYYVSHYVEYEYDNAMSLDSKNAVQNMVVTSYINEKLGDIDTILNNILYTV